MVCTSLVPRCKGKGERVLGTHCMHMYFIASTALVYLVNYLVYSVDLDVRHLYLHGALWFTST